MENSYLGVALIILFTLIYIVMRMRMLRNMKEDEEAKRKEDSRKKEESERQNEKRIRQKHNMLEVLSEQLNKASTLEVPEVAIFKQAVITHEKTIIEKGGDKQLMDFLKVDSFLKDFHSKIHSDQIELSIVFDLESIKQKVEEESRRTDMEKVREHFHDLSASLEGKKVIGFEAKLEQLFEIGNNMEGLMQNEIKTLEFYFNMANAMLVFYLADKKIRFFEIFSAFERLGVFDSTWQKNVLGKLGSIESRLISIDSQMTELNQNFKSILDSNESMVHELKELNSAMVSNNLLQGITAYQAYRMNRRLRG